MSAFIVSQDHIDFMVSAAIDLGLYWKECPDQDGPGAYTTVRGDNADAFGAMLQAENVASIQHRYSDWPDMPDPTQYTYRRFTVRTPYQSLAESCAQVLKAIACYEYQSCEHPGWQESEAKRVCDNLRHGYINRLPGYDDAQWEVYRPNAV
jgi:hypothetical protein